MADVQSITVSGSAGITVTNAPPDASTDWHIPEGGLAYPDFDMRITYNPDVDNVPGSTLQAAALGVGSCPLLIEVHGSSLADLQVNRRAVEAAFSQSGQTLTLGFGSETEVYDFFPTWPRWGVVDAGNLRKRLALATLTVPVNPIGA